MLKGDEIAFGERRQTCITKSRHNRPAVSCVMGARRLKAKTSAAPFKPRRARSRITITRQSSGNGIWAITGGIAVRSPRPPSTTNPPESKAPIPIPERSPRRVVWASAGRWQSRSKRRASAAPTASEICVPEPRPACSGMASWTWIRTPCPIPRTSKSVAAERAARSDEGPSADNALGTLHRKPRPYLREGEA